MVGYNKNKWLPTQLDLLERLIEGGSSYEAAVPLVGHPIFSCRTKMSELRSARRALERQKPGEIAARTKPPVEQPPLPAKPAAAIMVRQAPPDPSPPRTTSTSKLVMDAELRGRIAVQGITAGLLGDPLPGRSALDRRKVSA